MTNGAFLFSHHSRSTMSAFDRRQFLKGILGNLVQAAGAVVVASTATSTARAEGNQAEGTDTTSEDPQERADRLAATSNCAPDEVESGAHPVSFLNGAFRNTPWGRFRNTPLGGFRNTPLGNFRNTPLGAFGNSPLGNVWGNGGWPNGGWGGFHNGGWPNGGWHNWW
jgi:hypothetical protein